MHKKPGQLVLMNRYRRLGLEMRLPGGKTALVSGYGGGQCTARFNRRVIHESGLEEGAHVTVYNTNGRSAEYRMEVRSIEAITSRNNQAFVCASFPEDLKDTEIKLQDFVEHAGPGITDSIH